MHQLNPVMYHRWYHILVLKLPWHKIFFPNEVVQRVVKLSKITLIYKKKWKTEKKSKFLDICWPLKLCLHDFAWQSLHCSIIPREKNKVSVICGTKSKRSMILQGKVCIAPWFCGAKFALLHNFAGQRQSFKSKNIAKKVIFLFL